VRGRKIGLTFLVLVVLAGVGVYLGLKAFPHSVHLPDALRSEDCTASASGEVTVDLEQMANAATITAVGVRRKVPERGIVVALATAYQESHLFNVSGGDRDSIGLFQQRPSQGWGTPIQIADPRYAAGRFYTALLRVHNWQTLSLTKAAQAVQHSALPDAYARWEDEATIMANALLGNAPAAVACTVLGKPAASGVRAVDGVMSYLRKDWGTLVKEVAAPSPGTVAVAATDSRAGWRFAHWLVAHASDSGIVRVAYANKQWTAKDGDWVSVPTSTPSSGDTTVIASVATTAKG
jgi:hypothetical protein